LSSLASSSNRFSILIVYFSFSIKLVCTMAEPTLFANVSFKVGGKRAYTYSVPAELRDWVVPGVRVRASFRGKPRVGFVVDITDHCDLAPDIILPLEEVLEGDSRFPPNILRLIEWTSKYYHATQGETMRAAYPFPSFLRPKEQQRWVLAHSPEETAGWIQANEARRPKQAAILKVLLTRQEGLSRGDLLKRAGASQAALTSLNKQGWVQARGVEVLRRPHISRGQYTYEAVNLTPAQSRAVEAIVESCRQARPTSFLLRGITGSGKTEVYLRAIEEVLKIGKTALALVPEISLTPQTSDRFRSRFGDEVGILHSALGEGERFDQWRLARAGQLKVIVGTRSAIFSPLEKLGLIVVDEEHDSSYKQEDPAPRYHARDLAVVRGQTEPCPVVLGSATPSLESAYNAARGKYELLTLPLRVTAHNLPKVRVVDLRGRAGPETIISTELAEAIEKHRAHGGQIILFLNRRGYSSLVLCRKCGHVFGCPNCSVGLVYHQELRALVCHHCGERQPVPRICPVCKEPFVRYQGVGTEQVVELVAQMFPDLRMKRMDLDSTRRKGAHGEILGAFRRGEVDLLVGTQMISKGLDFPGVSLVGVISADVSLNLPDFRAGERTFSLLTQVAGRAGRGREPGEVIIQSFSPRHYSIQMAIAQDYQHFFERELSYRKLISFPPVTRLTNLRVESENEKAGQEAADELGRRLRQVLESEGELQERLRLMGPLPAPLYRLKKVFRWHLTLKGRSHEARRALLELASIQEWIAAPPKKTKIIIDVDPLNML